MTSWRKYLSLQVFQGTSAIIAMASSPASKISDNPRVLAKRRSTNDGNVPQSAASNVKRESEKGEQFLASDSFHQRMEAMIRKEDVQAILDKQKETLMKFEKTNAKFGKFNDLSAARFLNLNQQLKNHTKMLMDMKKDLDSIFRRIRTLKTKLSKQYGPAFQAISAGIQKLEEELGASIENEDASSVYTLTESREFKSESQPTNRGHAVGQQMVQRNAEDHFSQVETSLPTPSTLLKRRSGNHQSNDNRTATDSDVFEAAMKADLTETNESCLKSRDRTVVSERTVTETHYGEREASSVKEYKDISTTDTPDTDDLIRTVETDHAEVRRTEDTGAIKKDTRHK